MWSTANVTLHVGLLTNAFVIQVGDRRLSRVWDRSHNVEVWDALANKSLLVDCTNGRLILSYAGSAFMKGLPTDEWLASLIMAPEWDLYRDRKAPAMRLGPSMKDLHIQRVLQNVKDGVQTGFLGETEARRRAGLHLMLTAITRSRNAKRVQECRMVLWSMSHSGSRDQPVSWVKAHPTLKGAVSNRQCVVSAIGDVGPRAAYTALVAEVLATKGTVKEVEDVLARFVRSQAAARRTIGPDLMVISVPVTAHNPRLRYMPNPFAPIGPAYTPIVLSANGGLLLPLQYTASSTAIGIGGLHLELIADSVIPAPEPVPLGNGRYQVTRSSPITQRRRLDSGSVMRRSRPLD